MFEIFVQLLYFSALVVLNFVLLKNNYSPLNILKDDCAAEPPETPCI